MKARGMMPITAHRQIVAEHERRLANLHAKIRELEARLAEYRDTPEER